MGRILLCAPVVLLALRSCSVVEAAEGEGCGGWRTSRMGPSDGAFQCPKHPGRANAKFCCGSCALPYCCSTRGARLDQVQCLSRGRLEGRTEVLVEPGDGFMMTPYLTALIILYVLLMLTCVLHAYFYFRGLLPRCREGRPQTQMEATDFRLSVIDPPPDYGTCVRTGAEEDPQGTSPLPSHIYPPSYDVSVGTASSGAQDQQSTTPSSSGTDPPPSYEFCVSSASSGAENHPGISHWPSCTELPPSYESCVRRTASAGAEDPQGISPLPSASAQPVQSQHADPTALEPEETTLSPEALRVRTLSSPPTVQPIFEPISTSLRKFLN
ncbi:protein shisa-3-like [Hemicordylus capensis]|uniref:protein shisa-3-like n=1 Tax=Hemicordylus capensis TaxID=884348 RepID=UPI0023044790|nr:protein shisa-3-like [Hemicordylus capensis]